MHGCMCIPIMYHVYIVCMASKLYEHINLKLSGRKRVKNSIILESRCQEQKKY
jgi:hypothetical protein